MKSRGRVSRSAPMVIYLLVPIMALVLTVVAGYVKWQHDSLRAGQIASTESVRAASDATVAMLSYAPDTVEQDLRRAQENLVGDFREAYTSLTEDVVIPGAKEKQISAVATVAAASSVSSTADHAVVLVFVNQTTVVGSDAPSDTASTVTVTLDKRDDRWLVSGFEPR
ncbi:hypothetical protein [Mycolicibacterium alvei]|nr:hypothetical protein [Mycolicibacterium alvei]MCV7002155.1 hypothetical protein [Mycolicibacterium alvei]